MKTHLPETLIWNDFKNPFSKEISIRCMFLMILNIFATENNREIKNELLLFCFYVIFQAQKMMKIIWE